MSNTDNAAQPARYYIASLKHTSKFHEHITFWGHDHRGYVLVIGELTGEYGLEEARNLNDGIDYIAVPVEVVKSLISPEPYFSSRGVALRFYDTPGPVVDNTKANWAALIAASLEEGREQKRVKPEPHTKQRRSFAIEAARTGARDE